LLGQGLNRGLASVGDRFLDFERREGLRFHMYDPATGAVTPLARTTVSRGLHGTATLLPDGTVFFAGENREALVQANDPSFPLMTSYAGLLPAGDPDQGVPVGQVFYPPYLFKEGGGMVARPVITDSPEEISYRGNFDIEVAGSPDQIASVVLLRSDHNTHSLSAGDRYVKLAFHQKGDEREGEQKGDEREGEQKGDEREGEQKGDEREGELRVVSPKVPAQATPGIYMLFVVDRNGVPSMGRRLDIKPESRGSSVER